MASINKGKNKINKDSLNDSLPLWAKTVLRLEGQSLRLKKKNSGEDKIESFN